MWGQCNETLLDRLHTLQNRAARVIANVSYEAADHNSLLCDYGWLNVRNLILLDSGVFMYKTRQGLVPDVFYDLYHSVLLSYIHIIPDQLIRGICRFL